MTSELIKSPLVDSSDLLEFFGVVAICPLNQSGEPKVDLLFVESRCAVLWLFGPATRPTC